MCPLRERLIAALRQGSIPVPASAPVRVEALRGERKDQGGSRDRLSAHHPNAVRDRHRLDHHHHAHRHRGGLGGDGTLGWEAQNPFDRVIVTAAALDVPPVLANQLTLGGVMVVPIGYDSEFQTILRVVRTENGFDTQELRDVKFVPLIPAEVGETG